MAAQIGASRRTQLPAFLAVRNTPLQGRGIFTQKGLKKNTVVFEESRPFAFGVSGLSSHDVKNVCSNCLKPTETDKPVECKDCSAVGYCSEQCLDKARPLHAIECSGLRELEKLREKVGVDPSVQYQPVHLHQQRQTDRFWPPVELILAARVLNQEILDDSAPKIRNVTKAPFREKFAFLTNKLPLLLHPNVSKEPEFLAQVFADVTAASVALNTNNSTYAWGMFEHYRLVNHSCQPNCSYANLQFDIAKVLVYADEDIGAGEQLCISYVNEWQLALPTEYRRDALKTRKGFDCACVMCTGERTHLCQRNQKKLSLIAPWTKQRAKFTMDEGAKSLGEIAKCANEEDWVALCGVAEELYKLQRRVLSETNSIRTLTAYFLMKAYYHQGHIAKALQIGESIRKPMEDYGAPQLISEYLAVVSNSCFDMGDFSKGTAECIRAIELYPRNIDRIIGPGSLTVAVEKATRSGNHGVNNKIMSLLKNAPLYTSQ